VSIWKPPVDVSPFYWLFSGQHPANDVVTNPDHPARKVKAGRTRRTLRFDYKQPVPPSKVFRNATPFSRLERSLRQAEYQRAQQDPAMSIDAAVEQALERVLHKRLLEMEMLEERYDQSAWTAKQRRDVQRRLSKSKRNKFTFLRSILRLRHRGETWAKIGTRLNLSRRQLDKYRARLRTLVGSRITVKTSGLAT
jgi:hypothetical protein